MGKRVEPVRTVVSVDDMRPVLSGCWATLEGSAPSNRTVTLLIAHWMMETGQKAMFNYNVGNIKARPNANEAYPDFTFFQTYELVSAVRAAKDEAASTPSAPCHRKVENEPRKDGLVVMIYQPSHPTCCFRSFPNLEAGVLGYLNVLRRTFDHSKPALEAGDPVQYAHLLKQQGYYTADESKYASLIQGTFYRVAGLGKLPKDQDIKNALSQLGYADVKSFQAATGLQVDGIVGAMTRGALALALEDVSK